MPAPDPHARTQEQSIKARKHELFADEADASPSGDSRRSFADCLRETPARPLDPSVRVGLWAVGVLVVLLLLAAFAKVGTRPSKPRPAPAAGRNFRAPSIAHQGLPSPLARPLDLTSTGE